MPFGTVPIFAWGLSRFSFDENGTAPLWIAYGYRWCNESLWRAVLSIVRASFDGIVNDMPGVT